jgi:hypothetical protein
MQRPCAHAETDARLVAGQGRTFMSLRPLLLNHSAKAQKPQRKGTKSPGRKENFADTIPGQKTVIVCQGAISFFYLCVFGSWRLCVESPPHGSVGGEPDALEQKPAETSSTNPSEAIPNLSQFKSI